MARLPNVLLLVADCARADRWLDSRRGARTPTIDRLRSRGVTFDTVIAEQACTSPCFTSLLTGLYSPRHAVRHVWGDRLPATVPLLTRRLADLGYHTYAEVTGPLLPQLGLARGFDVYEYRAPCDGLHTRWGDRLRERLRRGAYRRPWFVLLHLWELHPPRQVRPGLDRPEYGHGPYERAISSLDAQLAPLLATIPEDTLVIFTGDHGEKTTAEQYGDDTAIGYARRRLGLDGPAGVEPLHVAHLAGPGVLHELYARFLPDLRHLRLTELNSTRPTWRQRLADWTRLLRIAPRLWPHDLLCLGAPLRLTAMLTRRGLLDETRSAHRAERLGRVLGRRRLLELQTRLWVNAYRHNLIEGHMVHVYDFLVRVPLVLSWPGRLPAGPLIRRMVRQVDILPTLLHLLGVPENELGDCDGRPFTALLAGPDADRRWSCRPAYLSVTGVPAELEIRGVRTEEYKYTWGPANPELPEELYDLRRDPGETTNLAGREPQRCGELRRLADTLAGAERSVPVEQVVLAPAQQRAVERRLRELGYVE